MTAKDYETILDAWGDRICEKIDHYQRMQKSVPIVDDEYTRYGGCVEALCLALATMSIEKMRQGKAVTLRVGEVRKDAT